MQRKPNFSSLPSLCLERLSAELRANWDRCQSHLQPRGTPVFLPCLMKRQNNRFAYAETGVVTGLTPIDLGYVKEGEKKQKEGEKKEKFMTNSCLEVFRL